jgi:hypothetical protein
MGLSPESWCVAEAAADLAAPRGNVPPANGGSYAILIVNHTAPEGYPSNN